MNILILLSLGLATGVLSGVLGIGGGIVLVPALIYLRGLDQVQASATSLVAMLLPVGALGVYELRRRGVLTIEMFQMGFIIAFGLLLGTYFGARLLPVLPQVFLKRLFATMMLVAGVRMWLSTR